MLRPLQKLVLLLSMFIAANAFVVTMPIDHAYAATKAKKAKWQTPAKTTNVSKKKKKTGSKKKTVTKKVSTKKPPAIKKAVLTNEVKKEIVNTSVKKELPKKKIKVEKVPEENTLIVDQSIPYDELVSGEDRSSSPLLIVFITFVLSCVGGMLFLSNRKKQLEAAKMNFQETSNHELAFSSSQERLDSSHPTHSGHETPTTRTLFERTDKQERSSTKSAPKEPGFFGKMSSKAASLIKSKGKASGSSKVKDMSIQFDSEDMNAGSITTIGAVKSKGAKVNSKPPVPFNPESTLDPMPASMGAEPCSFEYYIEIQIAAQCWRTQKLSLETKLRETFNIDTTALIQYEFYWKQKISNNVALKKKYQELEPLYTAKYDAAG